MKTKAQQARLKELLTEHRHGLKVQAILDAEGSHMSLSTISSYARQFGIPLTAKSTGRPTSEHREHVWSMFSSGWPVEEIAEFRGITPDWVRKIITDEKNIS